MATCSLPGRAPARMRMRRRVDALIIIFLAVVSTLIAWRFDLAEQFVSFVEAHEDMELDEGILLVWFALMGGIVFAVRRAREYRQAVRAHEQATRHASFLAAHDPLTGLANRRSFDERLQHEIARARREGRPLALFVIDIDHFKSINDLHGHDTGDALLREVADRLASSVRDVDLAARLGGDEFVLIQVGAEQPLGAMALAGRLEALLAETYALGGTHLVSSGSIGVTLSAPDTVQTPADLLKQADIALYRSKAEGRGTYRFYAKEMDEALLARRELEAELRLAHAEAAFELYYQPQHRISDRKLVGYEALIRWHHPRRGIVTPGEFIQLAEDTGLIVPMTHWIIRQACQEALTWREELTVAVNISASHLRGDDLVETVHDALEASGLAPSRLELELTETVLVERAEQARVVLERLHALGVRLALDDFGTGYSSLSNLWRLPFDRIKIDRSFIAHMRSNQKADQIVQIVVELGAMLGCEVLAEGVETEAQLDRLADHRCDMVQGFLFGRPTPAHELRGALGSRVPQGPA